ncbi:hypothetical protein SA2016_2540 [Sinomonas atrocyanea]|uniref:Uncharacterized protein n=2 Tax=Sinomonas atrocyanea TaxID=37927 RepID=A0A127A167_9MICC|nr:hypothetical protein SA2016_2540 [Sinomonas atrocyanea]
MVSPSPRTVGRVWEERSPGTSMTPRRVSTGRARTGSAALTAKASAAARTITLPPTPE